MNDNAQNHYDRLEKLLAEDASKMPPDALVDDVLHKANRSVGIKDMLGLTLVNLWVVIAKIMAPAFVASHEKSKLKTIKRGE